MLSLFKVILKQKHVIIQRKVIAPLLVGGLTALVALAVGYAYGSPTVRELQPGAGAPASIELRIPRTFAQQFSTAAADHATLTAVAYGLTGDVGEPAQLTLDRPFPDGLRATSLGDAEAQLPFAAVVPPSVGEPSTILLHAAYRPQAMTLVYDDGILGRYIVTENLTAMTSEQLMTIVKNCDPSTGCDGTWWMYRLVDGQPVMLKTGQGVTAALMVRNGVAINVAGPEPTLSPENVLALASAFSAQMDSMMP
jgi:hypothetical protein